MLKLIRVLSCKKLSRCLIHIYSQDHIRTTAGAFHCRNILEINLILSELSNLKTEPRGSILIIDADEHDLSHNASLIDRPNTFPYKTRFLTLYEQTSLSGNKWLLCTGHLCNHGRYGSIK